MVSIKRITAKPRLEFLEELGSYSRQYLISFHNDALIVFSLLSSEHKQEEDKEVTWTCQSWAWSCR